MKIRSSYADQSPLGPVGIAMRYGLAACRHKWEGPLTEITRNDKVYNPLERTESERNHDVRADLKTVAWSKLEQRRPSFSGILDCDIKMTNSLWNPPKLKPGECRDNNEEAQNEGSTKKHWEAQGRNPRRALMIRVAIAGGINSAEFLAKLSRSGEDAAPASARCTCCTSGAVEDEMHIFWE